MECPHCSNELTRLFDEGSHGEEILYGYDCYYCGAEFGACAGCGTIAGQEHLSFCPLLSQ